MFLAQLQMWKYFRGRWSVRLKYLTSVVALSCATSVFAANGSDPFKPTHVISPMPWHPKTLKTVFGNEIGKTWGLAGRGLTISTDGSLLAAGGSNGVIYVWEARTLRLRHLLEGHTKTVQTVRFTPDGKTLLSIGMDKTIRTWKLPLSSESKSEIVNTLDKPPYQVAWSGDSSTFVIGDDIWKRSARGLIRRKAKLPKSPPLGELPQEITDLAEQLDAVSVSSFSIPCLELSHDGTHLAKVHSGQHVNIKVNDQNVISKFVDSTVSIWSTFGTQVVKSEIKKIGVVQAVAFSNDGRMLATGSHDKNLRLFRLVKDNPELMHEVRLEAPIRGLRFSRSGRILAVATSVLHFFDLQKEKSTSVQSISLERKAIFPELVFGPHDDTVFYVDGTSVRRCDFGNRQPIRADSQDYSFDAIESFQFLPNKKQFLSLQRRDQENELALWAFPFVERKPKWRIGLGRAQVSDLSISPDGKRFVFDSYSPPNYTLELWAIHSDSLTRLDTINLRNGHQGSFWCTSFSPDGKHLASGHRDGHLRIWEVDEKLTLQKTSHRIHHGGIGGVDYSPDGKDVVTVDWSGATRIRDVSGKVIKTKTGLGIHKHRVHNVVYSADGKWLVSGDFGGEIKVWNLRETDPIAKSIQLYESSISSLAISPDSRILLAASSDGSIVTWDLQRNIEIQRWNFPGTVHQVEFTPDGNQIISANGNGTVYVWGQSG